MTRRRRRVAIRLCELVAVVATQLAVVLLITSHSAADKAQRAQSCGSTGITSRGGKETCIDAAGHPVTVVNRASMLHLNEMDVRLAPIRVRRTLRLRRHRITATGVFVIVKATLHNKMQTSALFRPDEMTLILGRSSYAHDPTAEASVANSFATRGGGIRAGHSRTGTVIFEVPDRAAPYLRTDGNVVIAQFRDVSHDQSLGTVGYFRTYR